MPSDYKAALRCVATVIGKTELQRYESGMASSLSAFDVWVHMKQRSCGTETATSSDSTVSRDVSIPVNDANQWISSGTIADAGHVNLGVLQPLLNSVSAQPVIINTTSSSSMPWDILVPTSDASQWAVNDVSSNHYTSAPTSVVDYTGHLNSSLPASEDTSIWLNSYMVCILFFGHLSMYFVCICILHLLVCSG